MKTTNLRTIHLERTQLGCDYGNYGLDAMTFCTTGTGSITDAITDARSSFIIECIDDHNIDTLIYINGLNIANTPTSVAIINKNGNILTHTMHDLPYKYLQFIRAHELPCQSKQYALYAPNMLTSLLPFITSRIPVFYQDQVSYPLVYPWDRLTENSSTDLEF